MMQLDAIDRAIVNNLQGGFPLTPRPFEDAGRLLGLGEDELIARLRRLVEGRALSRFGPLWNAEGLNGAVCLCALAAPPERFDAVADLVNAHAEVAHNYEREHALNMLFVISADRSERIEEVAREIEAETGLAVLLMPKQTEYFVGFKVAV
jgi:DNA-binding Lrp family transcriptional regulator